MISFSKAFNILVLNSVTDITKLESADTLVVGSVISNIVGPGFSSTSFACLIHLSPEMLADEIQYTLRISIECHFHITSNLTELCKKEFKFQNLPSECNVCNVELPMYALLAQKPSIVVRDKDKVSKQYSVIHYPLKSCNDLSIFSLVAIKLPDTDR